MEKLTDSYAADPVKAQFDLWKQECNKLACIEIQLEKDRKMLTEEELIFAQNDPFEKCESIFDETDHLHRRSVIELDDARAVLRNISVRVGGKLIQIPGKFVTLIKESAEKFV